MEIDMKDTPENAGKSRLKIKIKSLAAESRIIRHEERKWPGPSTTRNSLYLHRVYDVRREQRHSLLAYGFLRNKPYDCIEQPDSREINWANVEGIALRFSTMDKRTLKQKLEEWKNGSQKIEKENRD